MLQYLILLFAIPLGHILAKTTQDEKEIYNLPQYFPTLIKFLAILSAITISQNQQLFLTSTFLLITTYTWHKS